MKYPWILLALALACSGKTEDDAEDDDDEENGDDGGSDDTAADSGEPTIIYPDGDRILLYYGHEGFPPSAGELSTFEEVDQRWKDAFGWNTDHRESWTEDLGDYRLIALLAPGSRAEAEWSADEISAFQAALEAGARIAILADYTSCASATIASLLEALDVDIRFNGEASNASQLVDTDSINPAHQLGAGLDEPVRFREPCYIDPEGGEPVAFDRHDNVLVGAQRPGNGGDVVLVGDFEFMADGGYLDEGHTGPFADNLAIVDPEFSAGSGR